ncbi:MAG: hypothetical protein Ct9H300mP10_02750 [Methanobacteriota archaeon]|nr:MAG: hypothetical protein Ct9H300mP10_02750 [Euryarchaeota archaeon]
MFLQPRKGTDEVLVDDSGYKFDDPDSSLAILKGTSFDEGAEDARARTEGRDDGSTAPSGWMVSDSNPPRVTRSSGC